MKKTILSIIAIFAMTFSYAQVEPEKAVAKAVRAHNSYSGDPVNNADKLAEAMEMIEVAKNSEATNKNPKTWIAAGEIYLDLSKKDTNAATLDPTYKLEYPNAAYEAFTSYKKLAEVAEKKFQKKEAEKGLQDAANQLNITSISLLNRKDYEGALNSLMAMTEIRDIQEANGTKITLADPADLNNHNYYTAYTAMQVGKSDLASKLFAELRSNNYDDASIYSLSYKLAADQKDPNAFAILEEGLAKYPDSQEILFAQINYLISNQEYDKLTGLLKQAVAADPENPSVYSALGNVYMNLNQEALTNNDPKAPEYFAESKSYYEQAANLDPNLFDVQYSLGSLYFNKAVLITKQMGELSLNETKKYDELKKKSTDLFNTALPYFKIAEKLNPNDTNTLIALKEIYARENDFEKSGEFKKRLENVQTGGKNESSYFN